MTERPLRRAGGASPAPTAARPGMGSVDPVFVADGELVELAAVDAPRWHVLLHERQETGVVGRLQHVHQLVDQDVLQALGGLAGEVGVEADAASRIATASPPGLHPLNE